MSNKYYIAIYDSIKNNNQEQLNLILSNINYNNVENETLLILLDFMLTQIYEFEYYNLLDVIFSNYAKFYEVIYDVTDDANLLPRNNFIDESEPNTRQSLNLYTLLFLDNRFSVEILKMLNVYFFKTFSFIRLIFELNNLYNVDTSYNINLAIDKAIEVFGKADKDTYFNLFTNNQITNIFIIYKLRDYYRDIADYVDKPNYIKYNIDNIKNNIKNKSNQYYVNLLEKVKNLNEIYTINLPYLIKNVRYEDLQDKVKEILTKEDIDFNYKLFKILGPNNDSVNDYEYDSDDDINKNRMLYIDDEDDWFTGSCDVCARKIEKLRYSVRRPIYGGTGWGGCYCSWICVKIQINNLYGFIKLDDKNALINYMMGNYLSDLYEKQLNEIGIYETI